MTVRLLRLTSGSLSLEFDISDLGAVKSEIHSRFGPWETDGNPMFPTLRFAGRNFVFQNEWDDPCLIASCPDGCRVLTTLHVALNGPGLAGFNPPAGDLVS